jgi:hypothetical protein
MVNPCPEGFCVNWHYDDPYDGSRGRIEPMCYWARPVDEIRFRPNGTVFDFPTGEVEWGWESGYIRRVYAGGSYKTLRECQEAYQDWGGFNDYFTIDPDTRIRCFSPFAPAPPPSLILRGTASPPPPLGRNMCCDCNTIATIFEDKIAGRDKVIKDHIDQRTIEELKAVNKMLQGMKIDLNLQPIIDRLNQVEANLWNGLAGG